MLCAVDDAERAKLGEMLERLDPIRDTIAHGDRPRAAAVDRFIGAALTPADADSLPWFTPEQSERARQARSRALEVLRHLLVAYLMATIRIEEGKPQTGVTRAELIQLIRETQRGLGGRAERLRSLTGLVTA